MHVNLRTLFGKSEPEVKPGIITLVTKTEKAEGLVSALTEKGIKVTKQDDLDGATTLHLTDDDNDDTIIFKMSDDVAVGVTGISKSFSSWGEGESFIKNMATAGFFPGVRVATDVFMDTMHNIMYKAEEGKQPTEKVKALTGEFSKYVKTLVSKLPAEAFKYDGMVLKAEEAKQDAEDTDTDTDTDTNVKKDDEDGEGKDADTDTNVKKDDDTDKGNQEDNISKTEITELMDTKLEESTKTLTTLVEDSVKKSDEAMEALTAKFTEVTEALAGVVSMTSDKDDEINKDEINKKEGDFDSALNFAGFSD